MAVSNKPWSTFSDADYPDAGALCDASLINLNDGPRSAWSKANCKLRVYEPGGDLNRNALAAAAAVLAGARGGVDAPANARRAAARKLMRLYREAQMDPPESLVRLATA